MEVELIEIGEFLARHAPFDRLPLEERNALPRELSVRYLRRGSPFPPADSGGHLFIVRTGAVEIRDGDDQLIEKFGEGELLAFACFDEKQGDSGFHAVTIEDCLFYLLPCTRLELLRSRYREFDAYFNQSIQERLKQALAGVREPGISHADLMTIEVSDLIGRQPVTLGPDVSIRAAAQLMTRERVSSLLITEAERLIGIVTDSDLRSRCIAEGLSPEAYVDRIMTRRLHKITKETPGFEALLTMIRLGVHHLPVVDGTRLIGIVSSNDLVRQQSANAVYLVGEIRRSPSVDTLAQACSRLPELQVQMIAAGATGYHIGQAISSVTDAITRRLLELARMELGEPPVPFTWLAVGSLARREQTIHSDQDHALLLDDAATVEDDLWFAQLARFVSDGLAACGFFRCPGNVMATNPEWRQPLRIWRRYFDGWITTPSRKALMLASNFFDMRPIAGDETLYDRLNANVLRQARDNKIFLAHLAANALQNRPPLGFFRNFVLIPDGNHAHSLDLKHRGLIPIIDLARVYALSAGLPAVATCDRLKAAAEAASLSQDGAANLADAFALVSSLRARNQAGAIKHGENPDNYIRPAQLSSLERNHLKDVFSVISSMQNALGQRYQAGRFL